MGTELVSFNELGAGDRSKLAYEILSKYCNGETIKDLAPKYRASIPAVYGLLVSECLDDYKNSQAALALQRIEKGYADLEEIATAIRDKEKCPDALELGRQRELGRIVEKQIDGAQWQLERTLRSVYGQNVPPAIAQGITINIGINRGDGRETTTIEAQT